MEQIINKLKSYGITEYEIMFTETETLSMNSNMSKFKSKSIDTDQGFGIRIIKNGKVGFAYFTEINNIDTAIKTAILTSQYRTKTNFSFNPNKPKTKIVVYDKKIHDLEVNELKEMFTSIMSNVKQNKCDPIDIHISSITQRTQIINSENLNISEQESGITANVMAGHNEKSGDENFASYKYNKSIFDLGQVASQRAIESVKSKRVEQSNVPIILDYDCIKSLIGSLLLPQTIGTQSYYQRSKLIGKQTQQITSEKFSLIETPFSEGYSRTNFDSEGVESKNKPIISNGIFEGFAYDRETAALEKVNIEGNCSRGAYSSKPGIGYSNLEIKPGKIKELESVHNEYALIGDVYGLHTANKITGDFSVNIERGYLLKNNQKQYIQGNMLSGNVYEMLNNITHIESNILLTGSWNIPRIMVKGLKIV